MVNMKETTESKMETSEIIPQFREFIESEYYNKIAENLRQDKKYVVIDFAKLSKFDIDLANELLENPEDATKAFELAIAQFDLDNIECFKVHFKNLPETQNMRIRDIRVKHYNHFYAVTGVIRHVSDVYGEILSIKFECPSCGNILNVLQKRFGEKKEPTRCGCGRKGKFAELSNEKIDSQRLVIEEELETMEGNQQPNKIDILLQYDLTSKDIEKFNTLGSRVAVTGAILTRSRIVKGKVTNELEKYVEANYINALDEKYKEIEISQEDISQIKKYSSRKDFMDVCINSFAPNIAGYEEIKKAIILQLYGGVNSIDEKSKKRNRGDMHILLIGDPATGKTQLAKAVEPIALKYRYSSGARASKAGLTVTLVKDEFSNTWGIEAGALILANKGIAILDEFDKMIEQDRQALHEQMESQTITIDKASIHTTLRAETSILACANWKDSRFNPNADIYSQIDFPDSLISRFDLYFIFIDRAGDEKADANVMKHVLRARGSHLYEGQQKGKETIDYDFWKKHIIYAKNFNPKLNQKVADKIVDYYVKIRGKVKNQSQITIPITARQGEAIQRLSEASARMHLRNVTEEDVDTAIKLIEFSLKSVAFDSDAGVDIDIIETGTSTKKRNLIYEVRDKINELTEKIRGDIPIDDILECFDKELHDEIYNDKDGILDKMMSVGDIFQPRRGFVKKL